MTLPLQPIVGRGRIAAVMRRLALAIEGLEEPAVEKIAQDQQEDPFQVLVATMLSAQTRDQVTHEASTRLFGVARTPRAMARLGVKEIERLIYPVSFYRVKAVHVKETCARILSRHGGRTPDTMAGLLALPGVGRKTANLVLILAHRSTANICVDTHVHRISNRLGWVLTRTPDETEQALYKAVHRQWWPVVNLYLVTWGQNVCRPLYPRCGSCAIVDLCPRIGVVKTGRPAAGVRDSENEDSMKLKAASAALFGLAVLVAPALPRAQKPAAAAAPVIVLETAKGTIEIETFPDEAPKTVAHIAGLVKKNFYNGLRFHRAEDNFLVQVGDPTSRDMSREAWWGRGPGSGTPIGVAEITKKRRHAPGTVAMAHSGDPKFADSQFYIVMQPRPGLDGKYTIFGRVATGLDVVKKLRKADVLRKASVKG